LHDWRQLGCGPAYLKLGKAIRYPIDVVKAFTMDAWVTSTSAQSILEAPPTKADIGKNFW